jgi:hypothetical protein
MQQFFSLSAHGISRNMSLQRLPFLWKRAQAAISIRSVRRDRSWTIQALWPHLPDPGRLTEGDDIVRQRFVNSRMRPDNSPFANFDA